MRRLTLILLFLAAIYSGYWVIGAQATERAAATQISQLQDAGWTVSYDALDTVGYPSRFDTNVKALRVTTPDQRVTWQAPFIQALSLSYQPNAAILAFAPSQTVRIDNVPVVIASDGLRASVKVSPTPALDLDNLTGEVGALSASAEGQRLFSLTNGIAALRKAATGDAQYDAYLDLDGFALPDPLRAMLDPAGALPSAFGQVTVDARIGLTQPINRHASDTNPQLTQLALNGMTIAWGAMQLRGSGTLDIDDTGTPQGRITLDADNWQTMLDIAVAAGLLDASLAGTARNMAALLAGGGTQISVPVSFQNGFMSLGPIPLGPAPKFR